MLSKQCMEKAVKYNDIITNSVILQNIIDMSDIIHQLTQEGIISNCNEVPAVFQNNIDVHRRLKNLVLSGAGYGKSVRPVLRRGRSEQSSRSTSTK